MSFLDLKISESAIQSTGVQSQPDTLTGSAADNKKVFDALPTLIIRQFNLLLEALGGTGAASEVPIEPIDGMTAKNVQQALAEISKNLADYIAKIKGTGGAAEVGVSAISGISASNTQQALVELKRLIDNLVIGTLPPGSVTANMIEDGAIVQLGALLAVAAAAAYDPEGSYAVGDYCTNGGKLHKCGTAIPDGEPWTAEHWTETSVAAELAEVHALLTPLGGATTPQAALAALGAGVQDNDLINPFFEINQRGVTEWTGGYGVDCWTNTENKDTAKITVGSDGEITLTSTVSKDELGCVFSQFLEKFKPGAIKTMSFMGSVISGTAWLQLANDTKQDYTYQILLPILNDSIFSYTFQIPPEWNETDKVRYTIYQTGPGVVKIKAAKKEPGDKQTLGYKDSDGAWHLLPQPGSDYATQLAKCQRYLFNVLSKSNTGQSYLCIAIATTQDYAYGVFYLPEIMRVDVPAIDTDCSEDSPITAVGVCSSGYSNNILISEVIAYSGSPGRIVLRFKSIDSSFVIGNKYQIYLRNQNERKLLFVAEL